MKRRRRWVVGGAAVVAALWFLLGGPGTASGGDSSSPVADEPAAPPVESSVTATLTGDADVREPSPAVDPDPGLSDRLAGLLYRANALADEGRFGDAFVSLDRADALELESEAMLERRRGVRARIEAALSAAVDRVVDSIEEARILEAERQLDLVCETSHEVVEGALETARERRGLEPWSDRVVAEGAPSALAWRAGERVRMDYRGAWCEGNIVSVPGAPDGDLTVEVREEGRARFAFLGAAEVEPVQPTLDDAIRQVQNALAARDARRAALWLSVARGLGGGQDPRLVELVEHLR